MKKLIRWILIRIPLYSKRRLRQTNAWWHNRVHQTRPPHVLYHIRNPSRGTNPAPGNEEFH